MIKFGEGMEVILRCKSRLQVMLAQKKKKKKITILNGTLGHRIFFLPNLTFPISSMAVFERSVN